MLKFKQDSLPLPALAKTVYSFHLAPPFLFSECEARAVKPTHKDFDHVYTEILKTFASLAVKKQYGRGTKMSTNHTT